MASVRVLQNIRRTVRLLTVALCLAATWPVPNVEAGCFGLPEVLVRLLNQATARSASEAARPGDILTYLHELRTPNERRQFQTLITAARRQVPPLRGLETYERVLFTAVRTQSDPKAIRNTLIPLRAGGENVVADMIRHLEEHPPCHEWSICGEAGSKYFARMMKRRKVTSDLPSMSEQVARNPTIATQATREQAALLGRLRELQQNGEIRYEDLIRLSIDFAHHNRLNFDVRQLSRPDFAPTEATDFNWLSFHTSVLNPPPVPNRETLTRALLNPEPLRRGVITFSTRSFGELEIGPPGFMITPIELALTPAIADGVPATSFGHAVHDSEHRVTMIGEANDKHPPLHDLAYQLRQLEAWEPFEQLRRDLPEEMRALDPVVTGYLFRRWHEEGKPIHFAQLYLEEMANNPGELQQRLEQELQNDPRWAREITRDFSRYLTEELGNPLISRRQTVSVEQRMSELKRFFPRLYEELKALHGIADESERWNTLLVYSLSPEMQRRPLEQRLLREFISRFGTLSDR